LQPGPFLSPRISTRVAAVGALLLVLAAGALAADADPGKVRRPERVAGCQIFPPFRGGKHARASGNQAAWNQNVTHAPRSPRSGAYIKRITSIGRSQHLYTNFGGPNGIPYNTVSRHRQTARIKGGRFGRDFQRAPMPSHPKVERGSDRHVLVLQRGTCRVYEMFDTRRQGHGWHVAGGARWNLHSARRRKNGRGSADAAGLPILPGLVRYSEIRNGVIRHAIRVSFLRTREAFIHPATHYASSHCKRSLPPMGLRLRLGTRYYRTHLHRFPRGSASRIIFTALYHYGVIAADNAGSASWGISGVRSRHWHIHDLIRLGSVPGRAFVVIRSSSHVHTPC
jgi:hypothetical protein